MNVWTLLMLTAIAGIAGTGLGGFIGAFFGVKNEKTLSNVLSFAGGVMLAIVCFDLVPESLEICIGKENLNVYSAMAIILCSLFAGVITVMITNVVIENAQNKGVLSVANGGELFKAGWVVFFAIAIHNIPEGMAIGSSGFIDSARGFLLAALIALHNVPEGMSVSCPLIAGGMGKTKGIAMSALSGASTVIGGLIGFMISNIAPIFSAVCVIFAGGAMLYVTFFELLPEAVKLGTSKRMSVYVIIGITVGLAITYLLKI